MANKPIRPGLMALREALAKAVKDQELRTKSVLPPAAGVPQGQELIPQTPTANVPGAATDLPSMQLPGEPGIPDPSIQGRLGPLAGKIAATPVSRRTILKGAVGAMMPDIPMNVEALAAKTAMKGIQEGAGQMAEELPKHVPIPTDFKINVDDFGDFLGQNPNMTYRLGMSDEGLLPFTAIGDSWPKLEELLKSKGLHIDFEGDEAIIHYNPSMREDVRGVSAQMDDEYDTPGSTWFDQFELHPEDAMGMPRTIDQTVDALDAYLLGKVKFELWAPSEPNYEMALGILKRMPGTERAQAKLQQIMDYEEANKHRWATDEHEDLYDELWEMSNDLEDEIDHLSPTGSRIPNIEVGDLPSGQDIMERLTSGLRKKDPEDRSLLKSLKKMEKEFAPHDINNLTDLFEAEFLTPGLPDDHPFRKFVQDQNLEDWINEKLEPLYVHHRPHPKWHGTGEE